jgi:hypothetical protein
MTIEVVDRRDDCGSEWRCVLDVLNDSCCAAWFHRAIGGAGPWERDDHPPQHARDAVAEVLSEWTLDVSGVR